jgi:hypothetical protein
MILPKLRRFHLFWLLMPLLLWWALKDIDWSAVWAALSRLALWQIVILVSINIVVLFFFSIGWWLILRTQGWPIPLWRLTAYRVAAFGVSYFTPGPQFGGEPLQVFLLQRNHGLPGSSAVAAIALDRVLEVLINFLILAVGIILIGQWNLWPGSQGVALTGVGALSILIITWGWFTWHGHLPLTRLLKRFPLKPEYFLRAITLVEDSERRVAEFCQTNPKIILAVVLLSLFNWLLVLIEYWLGMYFLGLALSPQQLITAVTINRLAFLAPLPGGLGALEGSQVLAMTVLGLDPAIGVSEGLIIRARDVLTGLIGLWLGWRMSKEDSMKLSSK